MSSAGPTSAPGSAPRSVSTSASAPVKRACDSCHRRKVKCIGEGIKPCKNCISAGLNCTYNAIPQKKGPKGSRAKVLSELRETQRRSRLATNPQLDGVFGQRSLSPVLSRTPGLITPAIIDHCIEYFFANLYPTQPILHRESFQLAVRSMDQSIEAYCKIASLCAYVMLHPNMVLPPNLCLPGETGQLSSFSFGRILLDECVRVRKGYDFLENPTILTVYTSYFIFGSYFELDKQNTAWAYLRQAMTLAHIMGIHNEETYKHKDPIECSRKRRLFWLLFITERAYAFKSHRPLTLYATVRLPTLDDDPTETGNLSGFIHLVTLYKPFDEIFFGVWNQTRPDAVPSWLAQLQKQLSDALPTYLEGTETEIVDLRLSQQWLKTMVWQLAISHGFISSVATDNAMCFKYPIDISRDLVEMSNQFTQKAMEVHGIGFVEKLFDIACTLVDVMACVPIEQAPYNYGPREYLNRFINLLSTLRSGQSRYLPMLLSKIGEVLPGMSFPMARALPSAPPNMRLEKMYEGSLSNRASQEATPYDSPVSSSHPAPLRHGSSSESVHSAVHFPEMAPSMNPPMGAHPYSTYTPPMGYPDIPHVPTTTATPAQAMYNSHLPQIHHGHTPYPD